MTKVSDSDREYGDRPVLESKGSDRVEAILARALFDFVEIDDGALFGEFSKEIIRRLGAEGFEVRRQGVA